MIQHTEPGLIHKDEEQSFNYYIAIIICIVLLAFVWTGTGNFLARSLVSLVLLTVLAVFIMSKKKVYFYTTHVLFSYPLNPMRPNIRLNIQDIKKAEIKSRYKSVSSTLIFYTKDKKYTYSSPNEDILTWLLKNYQPSPLA